MKRLNLILTALLVLGAATARADEVIILEKTVSDFDTRAARTNGREQVLTAISRDTGVPITTLETQRDQTGLGYGGLFIANSLASATGQTFDEIAALKASGHGWGWIAKQNNVKLGPIISRARNANKPFENENAKIKKVKKDHNERAFAHVDRGPGNSHGHAKGPKSNASFHSKGKGKGH
jgi:hypothetical protein